MSADRPIDVTLYVFLDGVLAHTVRLDAAAAARLGAGPPAAATGGPERPVDRPWRVVDLDLPDAGRLHYELRLFSPRPGRGRTTCTYDAAGNLLSVVNGGGGTTPVTDGVPPAAEPPDEPLIGG